MSDNQGSTPWLSATERGRHFAPPLAGQALEFDVNPAEWQHVCSARFGDGRPCGFNPGTTWTGNAFRYDIYVLHAGGKFAMRWSNGSGCGWLVTTDDAKNGESSLLVDVIARLPNENQRWDACHFLWEVADRSARAAANAEFQRVTAAFIDGRLKKHKQRGKDCWEVEIIPTK